MADEEEEDWYRRRQRDEDSSLEDEARPRGPLTWSERRHRSRWEDDGTSADDTTTSPTESDEGAEPTPPGGGGVELDLLSLSPGVFDGKEGGNSVEELYSVSNPVLS
eukprot:g12610.t1